MSVIEHYGLKTPLHEHPLPGPDDGGRCGGCDAGLKRIVRSWIGRIAAEVDPRMDGVAMQKAVIVTRRWRRRLTVHGRGRLADEWSVGLCAIAHSRGDHPFLPVVDRDPLQLPTTCRRWMSTCVIGITSADRRSRKRHARPAMFTLHAELEGLEVADSRPTGRLAGAISHRLGAMRALAGEISLTFRRDMKSLTGPVPGRSGDLAGSGFRRLRHGAR